MQIAISQGESRVDGPPLPLAWPLRASRRRISDPQRDLLLGGGLIWSAQRSFCMPGQGTTEACFDVQQHCSCVLSVSVLRADLWSIAPTTHLENDDS